MIRILNHNDDPVRLFDEFDSRFEFHRRYGFVSSHSLRQRQKLRKAAGLYIPQDEAEFAFELRAEAGHKSVQPVKGCTVTSMAPGRWKLAADHRIYIIEEIAAPIATVGPRVEFRSTKERTDRWLPIAILALVALLLALQFLGPKTQDEATKTQVNESQPVMITETKVAPLPEPPKPTVKVDSATRARRVVSQQLGFLKLLGKKSFSKVAGGLPVEAAERSPGAGKGAEGSGGELLADMGKGLHAATVGNSGVKGLGGIGTHGAGGGLGGYGDTAYSGVGGQSLSAMPLARDAVIDEGLDRGQIQATILRYLSQVRACYEEGLKRNQALIGQVTMNFEVNGGGNLNFAKVQRSSLNDRPVEDCISNKMMTWKFPQPRGGVNVKVSYPFMLRPVRS